MFARALPRLWRLCYDITQHTLLRAAVTRAQHARTRKRGLREEEGPRLLAMRDTIHAMRARDASPWRAGATDARAHMLICADAPRYADVCCCLAYLLRH